MSGKAFRDISSFLAVLQHFLKPIHLHHLRLQQSRRRRSHSSNKCIPSILSFFDLLPGETITISTLTIMIRSMCVFQSTRTLLVCTKFRADAHRIFIIYAWRIPIGIYTTRSLLPAIITSIPCTASFE